MAGRFSRLYGGEISRLGAVSYTHLQAARVKVDEDGVEGAAYTEAIVDLTLSLIHI